MSLLLLIDGYNVVAPVAPPSRGGDQHWLQRERMQLLQRLAAHLDEATRRRTCVVFDAANPPRDRPDQFQIAEIDVRFAVGYPQADDLLEELIAAHSAPKSLAVVSSDGRIELAARRRGCATMEAQPWLDDLLSGVVRLAEVGKRGAGQGSGRHDNEKADQHVSEEDLDQWMKDFGF